MERGTRDLTVDTSVGWKVGMGPWILTKEAEEGGGAGSSFRGEHLQVFGASWSKW